LINKTKIIDPRLGQRLRQIRELRGMSQGRLARLIGISVGTVQNYEHGRVEPTVHRFDQIAQELRCEVANLLESPDAPLPRDPRYRLSRQCAKPTANALLSIVPNILGFYGRPARGTLVEIDAQIKRICGLPEKAPTQLAWQSWIKGIHRDDRDRVVAELARLDDPRDGVFNLRYRLIGHDRVERHIVDYGHMSFDGSGQPVRLQGFLLDITQERRTKSMQDKIARIVLAFNAGAEG
jgi:transcriptional regulator with XRE-family HTH domain